MITLNQICYDILNISRGGAITDDEKISIRQVEFWIHEARATLIHQELNKGRDITDSIIQTLGCVHMEWVDRSMCADIPVGCSILRSTELIPNTIERDEKNSILSIEDLKGTRGFTETKWFRAKSNKYNKYTSTFPRWYLRDGYLYLTGNEDIKVLTVTGIFDNPSDVARFNHIDGTPCWTRDSNYPVSAKMAEAIVDKILKERMGIIVPSKSDTINDASGEIKQ